MTDRPLNVLLVFSDQETAAATRPVAHTPHHDHLAARAVQFSRALCTSPQCSPSRATLLTGLYPHQTGVETNLDAVYARELAPGTPTFGSRLRATGYATGYFGKWHLSASGPGPFGFTTTGPERPDGAVAEAAAAWLRARPLEPWCAAVSFVNPHDIYRLSRDPSYPLRSDAALPANWRDDLASKPEPQRRFLAEDQGRPFASAGAADWLRYRSAYADLLEQVDADLGMVLQALAEGSGDDHTLVIVTSDHGDLVGAHGLPYKGPCLYDELLHVPLLVGWPGYAPAVREELVSLLDLVPTLLEAAGLPADPALPGRSLRPLLAAPDPTWPDTAAFEYLSKQRWANPLRGLRSGAWQYNRYLWGEEELYDLAADPGELRSLTSDPAHAPDLARLRAALDRWRAASGDAGRWDRPQPVPAGEVPAHR